MSTKGLELGQNVYSKIWHIYNFSSEIILTSITEHFRQDKCVLDSLPYASNSEKYGRFLNILELFQMVFYNFTTRSLYSVQQNTVSIIINLKVQCGFWTSVSSARGDMDKFQSLTRDSAPRTRIRACYKQPVPAQLVDGRYLHNNRSRPRQINTMVSLLCAVPQQPSPLKQSSEPYPKASSEQRN
jgi:hypothetical protein